VFGGRTLDVEFVPPEPVVEIYDHRAERWRQVAALQEPLSTRDHHQTVVMDSEIYLLGGHSGPFNVYNSCRKYSLKAKKWVEIAPMREKRAFLASVVLGNSIYAIGKFLYTLEC
jgi:N-acetylneuraminic acid mutarotase